jgi:transcriptional regulator with XRE-family HTH domain
VAEDWGAVSAAVAARLRALKISQAELRRRSKVSKAIVGEIVRNSKERDRNDTTLEALSVALECPRHYLTAIRDGLTPPEPEQRQASSGDDLAVMVTALRHDMSTMLKLSKNTNDFVVKIFETMTKDRRLDEISPEIQAAIRRQILEFCAAQEPDEEAAESG